MRTISSIGRHFPLAALALIAFSLAASCATNAPIAPSTQQEAPNPPSAQAIAALPADRMPAPDEAECPSMTVQFDNLASMFPDLRSLVSKEQPFRLNPRLLVLIYHNLVFGRRSDAATAAERMATMMPRETRVSIL